MTVQHAPMTAEDLFALPDDDHRYELVKGELIRLAPTGGEHGVLTVRVASVLHASVQANDLGLVSGAETASSFSAAPTACVPRTRPVLPGHASPLPAFPPATGRLRPDLAVEVTSPPDRFASVQTKIAEYFSAGTRLVWVVEPATRTVSVYRSPHNVQTLGEDDELSGEGVLPGFRWAAAVRLSRMSHISPRRFASQEGSSVSSPSKSSANLSS